jgi:hypothetical protein
VNILRTAAATNQVQLRIKHFIPSLSSVEYQKLLYDEKSTDDDEDIHRHNNRSDTNNDTSNDVSIRKSSRRQKQNRHTTYNLSNIQQTEQNQSINGLNVSDDALQALINSRFKLIDLIDLLKKTYPKVFFNDQKRELHFMEQLSQTNSGEKFISREIFTLDFSVFK